MKIEADTLLNIDEIVRLRQVMIENNAGIIATKQDIEQSQQGEQ